MSRHIIYRVAVADDRGASIVTSEAHGPTPQQALQRFASENPKFVNPALADWATPGDLYFVVPVNTQGQPVTGGRLLEVSEIVPIPQPELVVRPARCTA